MDKQAASCPYILFADDNADQREMFKFALEAQGYKVDLASTAEDMLKMIRDHCAGEGRCYDIIVSDIRFDGTGLDGISALRQIKKAFPNLPVIMLSGLLEPLTKSEAERLGAQTEKKPVELDQFVRRIEHTLSLTQKGYIGSDRRRRSIPPYDCDDRRRATDVEPDDDIHLTVPTVLREAQADARSRTASASIRKAS